MATPTPAASDPIASLVLSGQHREAVVACVREYAAPIGRLCMALLGSQAEAEEAAQETFVAAHKAMPGYRGEGALKSWLFTIARRQCAKRLAKRISHERKLRLVHSRDEHAELPEEVIVRRQRADKLRDALEKLKPSDREALLLRYLSGLSYRDIAEACAIEETAARKRASRALGRLRSVLADEDLAL